MARISPAITSDSPTCELCLFSRQEPEEVVRLERCLLANQYFQGGKGTGLFLFVKSEALKEAADILSVPLTSGTGKTVTLA